VFFYGKYT